MSQFVRSCRARRASGRARSSAGGSRHGKLRQRGRADPGQSHSESRTQIVVPFSGPSPCSKAPLQCPDQLCQCCCRHSIVVCFVAAGPRTGEEGTEAPPASRRRASAASEMVEAGGVEPPSEKARNEETTCVAGSKVSVAASEPTRAAAP